MITEDVPEKYSDLDFTPPSKAQDNAQKVIDWKDEHGDEVDAMTQTGWERAHQLADGEELSPDVISRMAAFERHEDNAEVSSEYEGEPWKDNGHVAWLGWGGRAGIEWAQDMEDKMDKIDKKNESVVKLTESKLRQIVREEIQEQVQIRNEAELMSAFQGLEKDMRDLVKRLQNVVGSAGRLGFGNHARKNLIRKATELEQRIIEAAESIEDELNY
jgi:hypothetical protein